MRGISDGEEGYLNYGYGCNVVLEGNGDMSPRVNSLANGN